MVVILGMTAKCLHGRSYSSIDVEGQTPVKLKWAYNETAVQLWNVVPLPSDNSEKAYEPVVARLRRTVMSENGGVVKRNSQG